MSVVVSRRHGFTLVELLVVLVLLVFFGLAIGGLARTITDARDRVDESSETNQLARTILQRISDELASVIPLPVPLNTADEPTGLVNATASPTTILTFYHEDTPNLQWGLEEDTLRFTTARGDPRQGNVPQGELIEVAYFVDTDPQTPEQGLVRSVGTLPGLLPEETQPEQVPREVLSERVVALDFQFYDPDTGEWLGTWERTDMLPALVSVTLGIAPVPCDEFFARLPRDQSLGERVEWFTTTVALRVRSYPDPSVQGSRQRSGGGTSAALSGGVSSASPNVPPVSLPFSGQRPSGQTGQSGGGLR